jgi:hypothetical protein
MELAERWEVERFRRSESSAEVPPLPKYSQLVPESFRRQVNERDCDCKWSAYITMILSGLGFLAEKGFIHLWLFECIRHFDQVASKKEPKFTDS